LKNPACEAVRREEEEEDWGSTVILLGSLAVVLVGLILRK
jgi:hypothetical protein